MGRKHKKCLKKCQNHIFHLRPFHSMAYLSREVQLTFCPIHLDKSPNYPSFNKDRKHYTSSFCLRQDLSKYESDDSFYRTEHDKFCLEQDKGKSQLFQPKPRSKNQYCYVCKVHYEDYYRHVKSDGHKVCIRKNKFTSCIQSLIMEKYPPRRRVNLTDDSGAIEEESFNQQIKQFGSMITMTSSLSSSKNLNEHQHFSSFRPLNSQGVQFIQLARKQSAKPGLSLQLGENKVPFTPYNLSKKEGVEGLDQTEKKSPNSTTKLHYPIIINSPSVVL